MNFTPSPAKLVRLVDEEGNVVKQVRMNRATRRRLRIKGKNNANTKTNN